MKGPRLAHLINAYQPVAVVRAGLRRRLRAAIQASIFRSICVFASTNAQTGHASVAAAHGQRPWVSPCIEPISSSLRLKTALAEFGAL